MAINFDRARYLLKQTRLTRLVAARITDLATEYLAARASASTLPPGLDLPHGPMKLASLREEIGMWYEMYLDLCQTLAKYKGVEFDMDAYRLKVNGVDVCALVMI